MSFNDLRIYGMEQGSDISINKYRAGTRKNRTQLIVLTAVCPSGLYD